MDFTPLGAKILFHFLRQDWPGEKGNICPKGQKKPFLAEKTPEVSLDETETLSSDMHCIKTYSFPFEPT